MKGEKTRRREIELLSLCCRNSAFEGVLVFNDAGQILWMNSRAEDILEYPLEKIASLGNLARLLFPEDPNCEASLKMILEEKAGGKDTFKIQTGAGAQKWCKLNSSHSVDGKYFIIHILDNTESRCREEALGISEHRFRTLFDDSKDAISISGATKLVNQAWLDMFGYTREDLKNFDATSLYVKPEDRKHYLSELEENGFVKDYPVRLRRKDGREIECLYTTTVHYENGKKYIQGIIRDITREKKSAEAQRESESKFRSLFEESKDAISFYSPRERVVNQAWLDLFGYTREEVQTIDLMKLYVNPDDRKRYEREMEERGFVRDFEIQLVRKDGTKIDCVSNAIAHRGDDGETKYYQGILKDITPWKTALAALRESRERLSAFLDSATEGFFLFDSNLNLVEINLTAQQEFGLKKEEITGKSLSAFLKCIRFPVSSAVFIEVLHSGRPLYLNGLDFHQSFMDFKLFRVGNGIGIIATNITEQKHAEYALQKAHAELELRVNERTAELYRLNLDLENEIAERKRMQEALARRESELNALLNNLTDIAWLKDTESKFILVNQALAKWSGLTPEEMKGLTDFDLWPREYAERYVEDDRKIMRNGETLRVEEPLTSRSGKTVIIETIKSPIQDESGKVVGSVGIARDITERKQFEEALRQNHDELELRVRERTEILARTNRELGKEIQERKRAERMLEFQAEFQKHISAISTNFINLPIQDIDSGIITALKILGTFSKVDRGFVYEYKDEGKIAQITHEWCAKGIDSRFNERFEVPSEWFRWTTSQLRQFRIVHVPRVSAMAPEAAEDRKRCESWHIRSYIAVPMIQEGKLTGFFGFESVRSEKDWSQESHSLLKLVSEILVNALERREAGRKIHEYQEKLRSVASELTLAEERERRRIAVELHDHIGQTLAVSKIKLGAIKEKITPQDLTEKIDEISGFINEAIKETRSLIFEISPPVLYDLGLEAALEWLTDQVRHRHGIRATFQDDGEAIRLDDNMNVLLFQFVRELLVNVVKHAQANSVFVRMHRGTEIVEIKVADDGVGFDFRALEMRPKQNTGFGLFSIRERLDHLGGSFNISSKADFGTTVTLTVPIRNPL